ncbi:MAG: M48 family metallopeptidase [Paraprevotella sp.]|nr:M48 family metallopeptidase [Paraprevotella sp.]
MIDNQFKIETDQLTLMFTEGTCETFLLRHQGEIIEIIYPPHTNFRQLQPWLFKVITEILRKKAKEILPTRLYQLAARHGFHYRSVSINSARTRWGSCSNRGNINLSLYLMILPRHLSDYVLLHELCHTKEMNHGPRFWACMDQVTQQQAKALRNELRHYPSPFR